MSTSSETSMSPATSLSFLDSSSNMKEMMETLDRIDDKLVKEETDDDEWELRQVFGLSQ